MLKLHLITTYNTETDLWHTNKQCWGPQHIKFGANLIYTNIKKIAFFTKTVTKYVKNYFFLK